MKQKLDIEIVATPEEEQQIHNLIDFYNLPYEDYANPEDNFYYIKGIVISKRLLLLLQLTGAEIYTTPSK
jgi:hypothetical protein